MAGGISRAAALGRTTAAQGRPRAQIFTGQARERSGDQAGDHAGDQAVERGRPLVCAALHSGRGGSRAVARHVWAMQAGEARPRERKLPACRPSCMAGAVFGKRDADAVIGRHPWSCCTSCPAQQATRVTEHSPVQFKGEKSRSSLSHADAEIAEYLILRYGAATQSIQNEVRKRGTLESCGNWGVKGMRSTPLTAGWNSGGPHCRSFKALARKRCERRNHILHPPNEKCPFAYEQIASARAFIERMARHGQHLTPLIQCVSRGDEAAGAGCCLNHDHSVGKAGDDPVALWKVPRQRLHPRRLLAQTQAGRRDPGGQIGILPWIDHVYPARLNSDSAMGERCLMRRGVDPPGKAGDLSLIHI